MPLSIVTRLRDGRYDAGGTRSDTAEWPPHPARLFCALVASAVSDEHWQALRRLETAEPPEVWASGQYESVRRDGYVVTNATSSTGGSQHRLGRTNIMRTRFSAEPDDPEFAFVWPDTTPSSDDLRDLSTLARRVPYLGRSTCPVTLRVGAEAAEPRPSWQRYVPTKRGRRTDVELRIPYDGYTDELRRAYADGRRSGDAARTRPYVVPAPESAYELYRSAFDELLIFGFAPGTVKPAGDRLLAVTSRLREAVIARIGTDVPPQVSGHGADDRHHLGYLALPNAGHEHADGRLMGVAIAVPSDIDRRAYARLWAAVVERPLTRLTVRRDQVLPLEYLPAASTPWSLNAGRWTAAGAGGARTWVSVSPVMLEHYLKKSRDRDFVINEVAESLKWAGLPTPVDCDYSPAPMVDGALHRPAPGTIPAGRPRRPMVHVKVTFDRPVIGPVVAGSMRFLGLGLFVPGQETS